MKVWCPQNVDIRPRMVNFRIMTREGNWMEVNIPYSNIINAVLSRPTSTERTKDVAYGKVATINRPSTDGIQPRRKQIEHSALKFQVSSACPQIPHLSMTTCPGAIPKSLFCVAVHRDGIEFQLESSIFLCHLKYLRSAMIARWPGYRSDSVHPKIGFPVGGKTRSRRGETWQRVARFGAGRDESRGNIRRDDDRGPFSLRMATVA